jgi:hypothetical protein
MRESSFPFFFNYHSIKWIIFTFLSLTVPAMFFLVMAVMFIPAIFILAGIFYVIPKVFIPGHASESLWFIVILGLHVSLYAGAYYVISVLSAKAIMMMKGQLARACILAVFCMGLVLLTQFPVYGGGGHGPIRWMALSAVFGDVNKSYGAATVAIVYGTAILLLCVKLLSKKHRKNVS